MNKNSTVVERTIEVELFADYFQFYIQDDDIEKGNLEDHWSEETYKRLLVFDRFVVCVGTARNMIVPVRVFITTAPKEIDFHEYDLVNRCGLEIQTGRIVLAGCTDDFHDALRIRVPAGFYEVRVGYGNLEALSEDGLDGDDFYDVYIHPSEGDVVFETIKDSR